MILRIKLLLLLLSFTLGFSQKFDNMDFSRVYHLSVNDNMIFGTDKETAYSEGKDILIDLAINPNENTPVIYIKNELPLEMLRMIYSIFNERIIITPYLEKYKNSESLYVAYKIINT